MQSYLINTYNPFPATDLCGLCAYRYHSGEDLWEKFIPQILEASQHPDDPDYTHREWTEEILNHFSPTTLARALVARSDELTRNEGMDRVVQIIRQNINAHLEETNTHIDRQTKTLLKKTTTVVKPNTEKPSPLRIAIVGGSTTEGNGCNIASVHIPKGSIMSNPTYCAWPYRFEYLINKFAGFELVQVVNMAEDGTETALMTPLLRNWLYPSTILPDGPDVVINAYSMSDYFSTEEVSVLNDKNNPPNKKIIEEMVSFVEAVESSHPCGHTPLVIHMYDAPRANDNISRSLNAVKDNVVAINYNDIIAKAVALDDVGDRLTGDIPFGMTGHLLLSWVLAFSFAEVIIQYCTEAAKKGISHTIHDQRPVITHSESNENVQTCKDASTGDDPCAFAWFSGPSGTVFKPYEITKYITPFIEQNSGWQAATDMSTGFSRKTGLVASSSDASITFELKNISKEVRFINLMVLKSNLPKFMDGIAQFTVVVDEQREGVQMKELSFEIDGSHSKDTPITYPVEVDLKDYKAPIGSTVRLRISLVQGTSFKILGMMFCS